MIRLHTLGRIELTADNGCDADALVAQPKRFALLCYLAFPKPGTMFRRDTLLGVFWPEGDSERSRTALRQALARIRKSLGSDVVLRRGSEEVGLNPDRFWCDVAAFEQALDEYRRAEAIELYRGELLKGIYIGNGPEFEHWLDDERARLAGRYATALEELANEATAEGRTRVAVERWQELALHDPYDSRLAMGLMEALDRAGDPGNALLHARNHSKFLKDELEIAAPAEMEALVKRLLDEHRPALNSPETVGRLGTLAATPDEPDIAQTAYVTTSRRSAQANHRWRRNLVVAGGGAALALAVASALVPWPNHSRLDPRHVVVAAFHNATGDPALDLFGERVGHWVTHGIQQAAIPVTPWEIALQAWNDVQTEAVIGRVDSPVLTLAEETGAGVVISGTAYSIGSDSMEVQLSVLDANRQRLLGVVEPVRGAKASESDVISTVRQRIMVFLAVKFDEEFGSWGPTVLGQPPSYEAYREYTAGYECSAKGEYLEATRHFLRAFELDSVWAQPLLRTVVAYTVLGRRLDADSVLNIVQGIGNRLTPYDAAVARGLRSVLDGDRDQATAPWRQAAQLAPGSPSAFYLGVNLRILQRPREAVAVLSKVGPERNPLLKLPDYWGNFCASLHMLDEHQQELEVARRAAHAVPGGGARVMELQARALAALGRVEELNALLDQIWRAEDLWWARRAPVWAVEVLRAHGYDGAAKNTAQRVVEWFESESPQQTESLEHWLWHGRALLLAGQGREALHMYDGLVKTYPGDETAMVARAFTAATVGNASQARRDFEWLGTLTDQPLVAMGAIAGALGDVENAMALFRDDRATQQFREAHLARPFWAHPYQATGLFFESVRGYPPFQDFIRPKG